MSKRGGSKTAIGKIKQIASKASVANVNKKASEEGNRKTGIKEQKTVKKIQNNERKRKANDLAKVKRS